MKSIPVSELGEHLSLILKQSPQETIVLTEDDRPIAIVTSIRDPEEIERLNLAANPRFQELMEAADRRIEETGGIDHEAFWETVERSP